MKNLCIYSLHDKGSFISEEHVVPAFLGGKKKLPKGYVEDSVNNKFSGTIEDKFSHYSPISFVRDIKGPGKRGKLEYRSRPLVAHDSNGNSYFVSMTSEGANIVPQLIFSYKLLEYELSYFSSDTYEYTDILKEMIDLKNDKFTFIEDIFAKDNKYIITILNKRWYLSGKTYRTIDNIKYVIKNGFQVINPADERLLKVQVENDLSVEKITNFDDSSLRMIAKIAFNFLALKFGNQYVAEERFSIIRNYILYGQEHEKIKWNIFDGVFDDDNLRRKLELNEDAHIIILYNDKSCLNAIVQLYGSFTFSLEITDSYDDRDIFNLFVCDWSKNKEFDFTDFILKDEILINHDSMYKEKVILNWNELSSDLFGKKVGDYVINFINSKKVARLNKKIKFYYDTRIQNVYSQIEFKENETSFYINTNLSEETFNHILFQGIKYIEFASGFKCMIIPRDKDAVEEKEIANYINFLASFSYIDLIMKDHKISVDSLYSERYLVFVNIILNWKNENYDFDFLVIKLTLIFSILIIYNNNTYREFVDLLNDIDRKIIDNSRLIEKLILSTKDSIHLSRKMVLSSIIEILNIQNYVNIGNIE